MIFIIDNSEIKHLVAVEEIKHSAQTFLDLLDKPLDEVTILFENNDGLQKYNALFAQNDKPTDVLSFSNDEKNPETGNNYLGDIAISVDQVISQSQERAHSAKKEIFILIAHGILHLLGYDHTDPNESKIMFMKQDELIEKVLTEKR